MAQGASQSIESADELFQIFVEDNNNKPDIYFANRLKRIGIVSKRSNLNFFTFHLSNQYFVRIRNYILKKLINQKIFKNNFLGKVFRK